jgi:hypothetical protein
MQHPVQQQLQQHEFQKTDLSVQAPSSSDNDKLEVATAVRQSMRELSEAVSEEDKVMNMPLKVIASDANGSMSSVNSCKTYK